MPTGPKQNADFGASFWCYLIKIRALDRCRFFPGESKYGNISAKELLKLKLKLEFLEDLVESRSRIVYRIRILFIVVGMM